MAHFAAILLGCDQQAGEEPHLLDFEEEVAASLNEGRVLQVVGAIVALTALGAVGGR
jgi:hypothetical protein